MVMAKRQTSPSPQKKPNEVHKKKKIHQGPQKKKFRQGPEKKKKARVDCEKVLWHEAKKRLSSFIQNNR